MLLLLLGLGLLFLLRLGLPLDLHHFRRLKLLRGLVKQFSLIDWLLPLRLTFGRVIAAADLFLLQSSNGLVLALCVSSGTHVWIHLLVGLCLKVFPSVDLEFAGDGQIHFFGQLVDCVQLPHLLAVVFGPGLV